MLPTLISPVLRPNYVASGWGADRSYRGAGDTHEGLDFRAKVGDPAYAVMDGVVKYSLLDPGPAGEMIVLQHPSGLMARYMHLSKRLVAAGQQVRQGQLIGQTGATGITSSAAHLHFDMRMLPAQIGAYTAQFGTPAGGYASVKSGGVGVPAEPLIPVDEYAPSVVKGAASRGISLYKAGGAGLLILLFAGGLAWYYFKG
jgi:murein DD-endopeptidase MepM/ murein hydrolase activator NlpD